MGNQITIIPNHDIHKSTREHASTPHTPPFHQGSSDAQHPDVASAPEHRRPGHGPVGADRQPGRSAEDPVRHRRPVLPSALRQFGQQSQLQVLYSADEVQGLRSNPVRGQLSVEAALAELLRGTGASYSLQGSSVTISAQRSADSVDLGDITVTSQESAWGHVNGYVAKRSGTGTKTDTPLKEIPRPSTWSPRTRSRRAVRRPSPRPCATLRGSPAAASPTG